MKDLLVQAVPGRALPVEVSPQQFVGLRKLNQREHDALAKDVVLSVEGARFVSVGAVKMPDTLYYRRAIRRGDLAEAVVATKGGK